MPSPTFAFKQPLDLQTTLKAMLAADAKAWGKEKKGAEPKAEDYQKYASLTAEQALMAYATNGASSDIPAYGFSDQMSKDSAKRLGGALLQYEKIVEKEGKPRPDTKLRGLDGKTYTLEPKELSAYLQSATPYKNEYDSNDPENGKLGLDYVDKWAANKKIGLTGHGDTLKNGAEKLLIETRDGQSRVVGNGNITKPLSGYYGGVDGVMVGDGDKLDIYISKEIYTDIAKGKPYTGNVFVMQQMDKGKPDELKVGYAKNVDEFADMQRSTWEKPGDFDKQNKGKIVELTQEQYGHLKAAIKTNASLTLESFAKQEGLDMAKAERTPKAVEEAAAPAKAEPASTSPAAVKTTKIQAVTPSSLDPLWAEVSRVTQQGKPKKLSDADKQLVARIEAMLGDKTEGKADGVLSEVEGTRALGKIALLAATKEGKAQLDGVFAALKQSGASTAQTAEGEQSPNGGGQKPVPSGVSIAP